MQSCKDRLPDCATGSVRPEAATASATSHEEPRSPEPDVTAKNGKQIRRYQCPFCQQHVKSTVETGQINHSFACGKFFRVFGGSVTGRIHKHACPTCATIVYSEKAAGQIKARHRNSAGRTCRRESERDGNAGLITLLVSNLVASLCRSLSSCPASRLDSAKRHCLNLQAWPAFLHCMPTANLLMSSWSWLSFCPASKTSISEPTIETIAPNLDCIPAFLHCQLPPCSCPPGAGFRSAQLRSRPGSKDPVAGPKHHGSEGRIGPAARSPDCQTLLSELTRN